MFIFILTYQKDLSEVDRLLNEHNAFLDKNYGAGHFVASGRRNPRIGGVIICNIETKEQALKIISQDPFYKYQIASYELVEFEPTKYANGFEQFK